MQLGVVKIVEIDKLKPHEEANINNLHFLEAKMRKETLWIAPVVVEKQYYIILDGHHRYHVAKRLGFDLIPAYIVDYSDPNIRLDSWVDNMDIAKEEVIQRGLEGRLFSPKSTRHMVGKDGQLQHIRDITPTTEIPFTDLVQD